MTTKPTHATKPSDRIHARDGGIGRSPTEEAIIEYLDEQAASANPAAPGVHPGDVSPGLRVGERFTTRITLPASWRGAARLFAWWPPGTWVTAVRRVPLTEPEPVPAEPRDDFQIIHTALHDDEGLSSKVSELELTVYRRDRELEDARGEWRKQETRLVESNAELRSKVSELESENAELSRKNIDLFDEKEKTRATLTATEAKLKTAIEDCEFAVNGREEAKAELARVRGEREHLETGSKLLARLTKFHASLALPFSDAGLAFAEELRVWTEANTDTPAVAGPAVVQREIVVGSTWADTQGIYADGEVTSYNPQLPDTIRITGASSWSEPVFRCRWRHVSDPPTKESAGKRKS